MGYPWRKTVIIHKTQVNGVPHGKFEAGRFDSSKRKTFQAGKTGIRAGRIMASRGLGRSHALSATGHGAGFCRRSRSLGERRSTEQGQHEAQGIDKNSFHGNNPNPSGLKKQIVF
jgi:hypothetical protein